MTESNKIQARSLKPGMVIERSKELWICSSYEAPAGTVPMPEAVKYCEPSFVRLKHMRLDKWVRTHDFTYMLFKLEDEVKINDSVLVQVANRTGPFLRWSERIAILNKTHYDVRTG